MKKQRFTRTGKQQTHKRPILIGVACLVLLALVLGGLQAAGVTHFFHKAAMLPASKVDTSGGGADNNQKGQPQSTGTSSSAAAGSSKSNTGGTASTDLLAPNGNFVSDHNVSLSTPLTSVCNTTPGASCVITFTSGAATQSLSSQTANQDGAVYWNGWTPQSIGLTAGTWQVQAVASLDGQTKTASDATALVITQ